MKNKIISMLLVFILLIASISGIHTSARISNKAIKKIISIVYDDSGSMRENEKYAYASYSLQNLVSLMNPQDELNIVKMSEPEKCISIDLSNNESRQKIITSFKEYKAKGNTPFAAVNTAANWIKQRKTDFTNSQSVEFWMVVITDGQFEQMPDLNSYLNGLKESMGNSKYEGILVAIGNDLQTNVINKWSSIAGNHIFKAIDSNEIVNTMAEVSGLIIGQGGRESRVDISVAANGKSVTFNSAFPLRKFIVYEQNQSVGIASISANGLNVSNTADFTSINPGSPGTTARTIHCNSDEYIPAGEITINFEHNIDCSNNKLRILTDSAVDIKFNILDKSGNEIDLEKTRLASGDYVEFSAIVTSVIDNKSIDLKNWANEVSAQLVVNEQIIQMTYNINDNTFYGGFNIVSGSNIAYSIVTLPGYFRTKSDIINVYPIETIDNAAVNVSSDTLEISYKYCSEYEEVGRFEYTVSGGNINGICDFEFKGLPNGIKASVNGIKTDEKGKLSLKIHNDIPADIVFLRNKDYKDTEEKKITINVSSKQYVLKWASDSITEIVLRPVKRIISFDLKEMDTDLDLGSFSGKDIYIIGVLSNNEYLTKEELLELELKFDGTSGIRYQTDIIKDGDHDAIKITLKKSFISLFVQTGNLTADLKATTPFSESGSTKINYTINDSIIKYVFPLLLLLLLIVGIGYLPGVKKRISGKYCISANGEAEQITVDTASRLIPYKKENGYVSTLSIKATDRKDKIEIIKEDDVDSFVLNGEEQIDNDKKLYLHTDDVLIVKQNNNQSTYELISASDDSYGESFGNLDDDNLFDDDSSDSDDSDDSIF